MSVCAHSLQPSDHQHYDVCSSCGSFKHADAPAPETIYVDGYWSSPRSTIDDQVYNIDQHLEGGQTKVQSLVKHIQGSAVRCSALEIGCAPGVMLRKLHEHGYTDIHGIEAVAAWECDIHRIAGRETEARLHFGFFPALTESHPGRRFDLIVAMDVFEHSPEPERFLKECGRLLRCGGQLLLMAPLVTTAYPVPDRMFCPEHIWIHSIENMAAMLWAAGFHSVGFDSWCQGHEIATAVKGEAA